MEGCLGEVVHQGWLTKSPPLETRRQLFNQSLITPKWRRRWFVLRQGAMPGQFLLHYYTDPQAKKLKGVIDLDQCEQVDTGLTYQSGRASYQFMFDIKTPKRVYYLAADSEEEMTAWVDWVCQVCGLRTFATEEEGEAPGALTVGGRLPPLEQELVTCQPLQAPGGPPTLASPYMHLSECFTGGQHPLAAPQGAPPPPRPPSRHSPDYQNSPLDPLPADSSLNVGDDSVFLPSSPAPQGPSAPHPPTSALAQLCLAEAPAAPGRPPKALALRPPPGFQPQHPGQRDLHEPRGAGRPGAPGPGEGNKQQLSLHPPLALHPALLQPPLLHRPLGGPPPQARALPGLPHPGPARAEEQEAQH